MLKKQFGVFLIIGTLTVLSDYAIYLILLSTSLFSINLSKGIGFILGTIFSYVANKAWTFSYTGGLSKSIYRFITLYLATLALNISINAMFLGIFEGFEYYRQTSFLLATMISALVNFLGMKYFVFKQDTQLVSR
jgi:putative flippase GtrA